MFQLVSCKGENSFIIRQRLPPIHLSSNFRYKIKRNFTLYNIYFGYQNVCTFVIYNSNNKYVKNISWDVPLYFPLQIISTLDLLLLLKWSF